MPRDGSNVYSVPAGTSATTNTTIESAKYNAFVADVETDLNTPRPIVAGGTGASSASAARTALGLAIGTDVQAYDAELAAIAALAVTDGNVIVGNGSTWVAESGATARASLGLTIGTDVQAYDADLAAIAGLTRTRGDLIRGGAAAWERVALGTSGQVLTSDGTDAVWSDAGLTISAKQATTSGTAFDFTGIPSGVKEIVVFFEGVSLSGTDNILIQLGDAGGIETTGYVSGGGDSTTVDSSTSGLLVRASNAAGAIDGVCRIYLSDAAAFSWVSDYSLFRTGTNQGSSGGGRKSLSAELTQLRITRTGTDTFDAGAVGIAVR